MYILYLRHQGAIFMTPHMSLPISTTTACELLKSVRYQMYELMDRLSFMWWPIEYVK